MGDRQDIDALLIGALYGELDAADEARLEAHLASHPGDRATMDALAETRTRVRDGLAHMADLDPAPAISTLILQEAARRAPRKAPAPGERVGVLAWLANLFQPVARHPALAGAMALALVAGTAGVLYEKGKVTREEHVAVTDDSNAMGPAGASGSSAPLADKNQPASGEKAETDSYQVKLAEQQDHLDQVAQNGENADGAGDDGVRRELAPTDKDRDLRGAAPTGGHATAPQHHGSATATPSSVASNTRALQKGKAAGSGYVEVTTIDRQPKSLDDEGGATAGFYNGALGTGGAGGGGGGGAAGQGQANAGPSNNANAITSGDAIAAKPAPAPKAPVAGGAPGGSYDPAADAKLTEWAKVQHQRMLSLVKAGNCVDAGKVGSEIAMKAPEYYAANIENDRSVRACKQYIDQEKRKKANEQYKSRSRSVDEPALEAAPAAH